MPLPIRFWTCRPLIIAKWSIAHDSLSITWSIMPSMWWMKIVIHTKIMSKFMRQDLEKILGSRITSYRAMIANRPFVSVSYIYIKSYIIFVSVRLQKQLQIDCSSIHSGWCCKRNTELLQKLSQQLRRLLHYTTMTLYPHP